MNVEIMGDFGETKGSHYDFTEKNMEAAMGLWADRWVAHRLGDFIGLDAFLKNPGPIFVKLAARQDFALYRRGPRPKKLTLNIEEYRPSLKGAGWPLGGNTRESSQKN